MEKTLKQLQEENEDIVKDEILQEISKWRSLIDNMKDGEPFDEEKYLDNAKKNIDAFVEKCHNSMKLFDKPKSELRKDSKIKFKERPEDIPPDNFDFTDKKSVEIAYQNLKNKHIKKGS